MFDRFYQLVTNTGYTHPLHPTLVNIVIGLIVGAFVLAIIGLPGRRPSLACCARYCTITALVFLILTVFTGIMDWQHYFSGGWIFPIKLKMGLAALLFVVIVLALIIGRDKEELSTPLVAVYFLCLVFVAVLGYFGAELVFSGRTPPAGPEYAAGREIFRSHCSGCHPYGANIVHAENHLWNSPQLKDPRYLAGWLRQPIAPMPVFSPAELSEDQIRELFAYLNPLFYKQSETEEAETHEHD